MHKKKASLVPLTFEYNGSSDQDEVGNDAYDMILTPTTTQASGVLARKVPNRAKSPEPSPCSCNTTALLATSRSGSSTLTSIHVEEDLGVSIGPKTSSNPQSPSAEIPFAVDGHRAAVSLTSTELRINYSPARGCCMCVPTQGTETICLSEVLSAQPLPPVITKWLWHPFAETTHRLAIYTFRRSPRSPTHWIPRCIILSTPAEGIAQQWAATINTAAAAQLRRPRHLLVLINPFGGKRQAEDVYNRHVAPVFERAGIKTVVRRTQFGGHARSLLLDMSAAELSAYDGVVAVGGDGLFHEVVNGLLSLRALAVKRTTTESGGDALSPLQAAQQSRFTADETQKRAAAALALRVGHIPAGSTDAVACTLNGTRNAFSAGMRIALGDGVPLDVLRIDAADGSTEFATCMASYGFMGDLMAESEGLRWMGPLRYEVIGAKMLAANRSYHVKISYLPAEPSHPGSFSRVCSSNCDLCSRSEAHRSKFASHHSVGHNNNNNNLNGGAAAGGGGMAGLSGSRSGPVMATPHVPNMNSVSAHAAHAAANVLRSPFARHSRLSLTQRQRDWVTVEDDFAGIMMVIMPCRSDKSAAGVARYGHLSDGNIHLVMVRRCSRFQYLRFLMTLSSKGLEAGRHYGGIVEVVPVVAVRVEPGGDKESQWNVDGELLRCAAITAETHRGAIEVFARGVETEDDRF